MSARRAARRRQVMRNRAIFAGIVVILILVIALSIRGCARRRAAKAETKAKTEAQEKKANAGEEAREKAVKAAKKRENPLAEDTGDILMIVNKEYGLTEDYVPADLVRVEEIDPAVGSGETGQLKEEAAGALSELFAGAQEDGYEIVMRTGYRSYEYQQGLYGNYVERDGQEAADKYSGKPGYSEHQSGLCCDVGIEGTDLNSFTGTDEAQWIEDHSWEYGFVVRYPEGKEDVTGYMYESWHIRYVGKEAAKYMHEHDMVLEEYLDLA